MAKGTIRNDGRSSMKWSCNSCGKKFNYQKNLLAHAREEKHETD